MPPSIELRARQSFALTPRLQQSVRLLQLSSLEFQQELRTALDTNPFLEYDPSAPEDGGLTGTAAADGQAAAETLPAAERDPALEGSAAETHSESTVADDVGGDYSSGDYSGDSYSRGSSRYNGDGEGSDPAEWARVQPTLHEQLHDALRLYRLDERDREAARVVIEALDDDGYLRQELADLTDVVEFDPPLTEDELNVALRLVQTLDRPGLAARSLSECLALQINALPPDTPGRESLAHSCASSIRNPATRMAAATRTTSYRMCSCARCATSGS